MVDIATNLLPASALTQLRTASGQPYAFVEGSVVRVPIHSPTPSGAFVSEGGAIPVASRTCRSFRGCMNPLVLFLVRVRAGDIGSATVFAQHVIEGLDDKPLQRLTELAAATSRTISASPSKRSRVSFPIFSESAI